MRTIKLISSWIPLLAGLALLSHASCEGPWALVLAALPGVLLITGGGRMLLSPDLRGPQHVAMGSVLALLLALPLGLVAGSALGLLALGLALVSFLAGGWFQIRLAPPLEGVPAPAPSLLYSARVALDDAMLGMFAWMSPIPAGDELEAALAESRFAFDLFAERGWIENPASFHEVPPPLDSVSLKPVRIRGVDCEALQFESGFEPSEELPGRDRWLGYEQNRTAHALILRNHQPGPWLIGVHGFGMGDPKMDFQAFRAAQLHAESGLNVALFVLPVHGARGPGGFNGQKFFNLSPLDFVHAESQAIWDLRRLTGWIRGQGATAVGVWGISLGGYTSALYAALEEDLAGVIAGVPPSDVLATGEYLSSTIERRLPAAAGFDFARDRAIQRVVSPLSMVPKVPHENRFIYAASGDQFVPIEQVRALWLHWERPRIAWSTGGHVTALMQREARDLVDEAVASMFGGAGA